MNVFIREAPIEKRLHRNGVRLKFSDGGAGLVTPSKPPPPYEQLLPLPTPVLSYVWKNLLTLKALGFFLPVHHWRRRGGGGGVFPVKLYPDIQKS